MATALQSPVSIATRYLNQALGGHLHMKEPKDQSCHTIAEATALFRKPRGYLGLDLSSGFYSRAERRLFCFSSSSRFEVREGLGQLGFMCMLIRIIYYMLHI